MPAADHRLTSREMTDFVADGCLVLEGLIPEDINRRVIDEMERIFRGKVARIVGQPCPLDAPLQPDTLEPLAACYAPPSVIGEYLRLPQVKGVITSLVGADPLFDHDFVHFLPAGSEYRQDLHVDAIVDSRDPSFDVQLFYFPREVHPGEGGTRYVPGSHLRFVRAEGISRYQHVVGERQFTGPAGTLLVAHHGLWHCGLPNPSSADRWMHKIRLNPTRPQVRSWNTDDLDEVHNGAADHSFANASLTSAAARFRTMLPWQQGHEARLEQVARARLWRYLTGDPSFDVDYYLTRLESRGRLIENAN